MKFDTMMNNMFDFNELCKLYRTQKIDEARIMLYENINVLSSKCWYRIKEGDLGDTIWEIYILVDEWINQAIDRWYQNKEIYWFIKSKIKFTLINKKQRWDKMYYHGDSEENWFSSIESSDYQSLVDWIQWDSIRDFVFNMNDPYRTVMILKFYSDVEYPLDNIAKQIEKNQLETRLIYQEWLNKIAMFLGYKRGIDE